MTKKGFTLFEVLLVVSIVLLIFSFGFLGFSRYYEYYTFASEFNELVDDLHYAKQMSVAEQINYAVFFDYKNNAYFVAKSSSEGYDTLKERELPSSIIISSENDYTKAEFTFFGAVFESGSITLEDGKRKRVINIKPSGFINVKRINTN